MEAERCETATRNSSGYDPANWLMVLARCIWRLAFKIKWPRRALARIACHPQAPSSMVR